MIIYDCICATDLMRLAKQSMLLDILKADIFLWAVYGMEKDLMHENLQRWLYEAIPHEVSMGPSCTSRSLFL